MQVTMFLEGCYPYVVGGVSSWGHMLLQASPEIEFCVYSILPDRKQMGQFKYSIPQNVTEIRETYLKDDDFVDTVRKKTRLSSREKECFRKLVFGKNVDWAGVFQFFEKKNISVNDILMGDDFFEIVQDFYIEEYPQCVFTDFLWCVRSLYLPLFTILKVPVEDSDCYHAISTGYAGILACKGHYIHKKPVILTEHGIYTREREEEIVKVDWTQGIYKDLWIKYFYMLSECIYQCAYKVTSLFEEARKIQIELGCPKQKTQIIANGVYTQQFQDLPQKDAEDLCINVGAVLRVVPVKDVKTMINAFSMAQEKIPNLKLYIMGPTDENPEYYQECLTLVKDFKLENVVFTGRINVKDYLGKMDMTILTSISEGQPLSILESMAAGIPCIATDVGGCKELLYGNEEDDLGKSGIIVPVMSIDKIAKAIINLAGDKEVRQEMGYVGKMRVNKYYRNENVIKNYKELYGQCINGKQVEEWQE